MSVYSPLSASTAIRLIKLGENGRSGQLVELELFEIDIQDTLDYTALSYQWGGIGQSLDVKINGIITSVHENLGHFLNQLAAEDDHRSYWIDAICIQQDDLSEKNQQIAMMAEIYASASQVVIWLGPHPHIAHCLELFNNRKSFASQLYVDLGLSETLSCTHALVDLLRLEYWRRAWIVQEIALARQLKLKAASTTIHFDNFLEAFRRLRSAENVDSNSDDDVAAHTHIWLRSSNIGQSAMIVQRIRDLISDPQSFQLIQWLQVIQTQGCKDDRDRVYSLLGLYRLKSSQLQNPRFALPNYGKDAFLVQWDAVFMLLHNSVDCAQGDPIAIARQIAQILNLSRVERQEYHSSQPGDEDIRVSPEDLQQGMFARHDMLSFFPLLDSLMVYTLDKSTDPGFQKLAESSLLAAVALAMAGLNYWKFDINMTWKDVVADTTTNLHQWQSAAKASLPVILGQLIALYDKQGTQILADAVSNCNWRCSSCQSPLDNIWVLEQPIVHSQAHHLNSKDSCTKCRAIRQAASEAATQSHTSTLSAERQMHGEIKLSNLDSSSNDTKRVRSDLRAGFFNMYFRSFDELIKPESQHHEVRRIIWVHPGALTRMVRSHEFQPFDTPTINSLKRLPFIFLNFHVSKGAPVVRSARKLLNRSPTSGRIGNLTQIGPDRRCGCKGPYPWMVDNELCRSCKHQSSRRTRIETVLANF